MRRLPAPVRGNVSDVAGLIPAPPQRPRTGFPWFGLMIAIILLVAGIAYFIGGVHAVIVAFVLYGAVILPLVFLAFTVDAFRRGLRRSK